jgi:hypothetical protein
MKPALLTSLHVSTWSASKLDRAATDEVHANHSASRKAGRYSKHLLGGDPPELKAAKQAATALRAHHYAYTLPWGDGGQRVLPGEAFEPYTKALRRLTDAYKAAAAEFVTAYPTLRERARQSLGTLFRDTDYPSQAELSTAFDVQADFAPVPTAGDFRVELSDEQVAEFETAARRKLEQAQESLMQRLREPILTLASKLREPEAKRYHETLLGGLKEAAEAARGLNLTDSPVVAEAAAALDRLAASTDLDTLRKSPEARATAAAEADRILAAMSF